MTRYAAIAGILLAIVAAGAGLYTSIVSATVSSPYTAYQADINKDNVVNPGDQAIVASQVGHIVVVPTATSFALSTYVVAGEPQPCGTCAASYAFCDSGDRVTGGGADRTEAGVSYSIPTVESGTGRSGWSSMSYATNGPGSVAYAVCLDNPPARVAATSTPSATATEAATATPTSAGTPLPLGVTGVRPWAVLASVQAAAGNGIATSLTLSADGVTSTGILPIQLDGVGATAYSLAIEDGSSSILCATGTANCAAAACPGLYPDSCGETSPVCDGPVCTPAVGNLTGPTQSGIDFLMANSSTDCDTFEEAFTPDGGGAYQLNSACDPTGGGACASQASPCSRRVLVLPLIDSWGASASDPVAISGFAMFWLDGYTPGQCQGNTCTINGRFVNAAYAGPH